MYEIPTYTLWLDKTGLIDAAFPRPQMLTVNRLSCCTASIHISKMDSFHEVLFMIILWLRAILTWITLLWGHHLQVEDFSPRFMTLILVRVFCFLYITSSGSVFYLNVFILLPVILRFTPLLLHVVTWLNGKLWKKPRSQPWTYRTVHRCVYTTTNDFLCWLMCQNVWICMRVVQIL